MSDLPPDPPLNSEATRTVGIGRAFLATICGFGLMYVGRLRLGILIVAGVWIVLAVMAWTRLIVQPVGWCLVMGGYASGFLLPFGVALVLAWKQPVQERKNYNRWWVYVLWTLGVWAANAQLTGHRRELFGYETFRVPSVSMDPTLIPGDLLLTDSWRYRSQPPGIGDIVVYRRHDRPGSLVIKRVVGVPGDVVALSDGQLLRNGMPVSEPYLHRPNSAHPNGRDMEPVRIAEGRYFVLGDYRDNSADSRYEGTVSRDDVVGRVEFIWLSFSDGTLRWSRFGMRLPSH